MNNPPDAQKAPLRLLRSEGETAGSIAVIGNEGAGLSGEAVEACRTKVTIPMRGRAESLNASAAAAILIWEMMRS